MKTHLPCVVRFSSFFQRILCIVVPLVLFFAAGCASTGKSTINQPFATRLGQYKSTTVEVTSEASKSPERLAEFLVQLESRIIAKLRERNAFAKIYSQAADADSQADLRTRVVIISLRDVNNVDRVMWGAFAGQANTKALVEVRERASDKLLGSGEIEGKSSGGSVMAGTTLEAVDRVADEVVRLIIDNL